MSDILDTVNQLSTTANKALGTINNTQRTAEGVINSLQGNGSTPTTQNTVPQYHTESSNNIPNSYTGVLGSPTQQKGNKTYYTNTAPAGTRIIIPAAISSTGKERYLGINAVTSILNMAEKKEGVGNIVVVDESNKPSLKYYDQRSDDQILIKGTNIRANVESTGSSASVRLSETEYEAVLKALKTKSDKVIYYKTSSKSGEAEDSDNDSSTWLGRNWWKVLIGLVAVGGLAWGGIAWYKHNTRSKSSNTATTGLENIGSTGGAGSTGSTNTSSGRTLDNSGYQLKDLNLPNLTDKSVWKASDNIR